MLINPNTETINWPYPLAFVMGSRSLNPFFFMWKVNHSQALLYAHKSFVGGIAVSKDSKNTKNRTARLPTEIS